jgi:hypothetical protein
VYKNKYEKYIFAIHTSDPQNGLWTCEIYGKATKKDSVLLALVDGEKFIINYIDKLTLNIENSDNLNSISGKYCGLNGRIDFIYNRIDI